MNWGDDQKQPEPSNYQPNYTVPILLSVALGLIVVLYLKRGNPPQSFEHPWKSFRWSIKLLLGVGTA